MKFSVTLSLITLGSFNLTGWFRISWSISIQVAYLYEYIINSEVPMIENGDFKLEVEGSNPILTCPFLNIIVHRRMCARNIYLLLICLDKLVTYSSFEVSWILVGETFRWLSILFSFRMKIWSTDKVIIHSLRSQICSFCVICGPFLLTSKCRTQR